jgi:VanZ family protein
VLAVYLPWPTLSGWRILLVLIFAAAIFEPLQFVADGRHPNVHDVVVKSFGADFGAIAGYIVMAMLDSSPSGVGRLVGLG